MAINEEGMDVLAELLKLDRLPEPTNLVELFMREHYEYRGNCVSCGKPWACSAYKWAIRNLHEKTGLN